MSTLGRARALSALAPIAALAAACAVSQPATDAEIPTQPQPASAGAPAKPIGPLPPQQLEEGECGLFLWSRDDAPELIFFANLSRSRALMNLDGTLTPMARASEDGAAQAGLTRQQSWRGQGGAAAGLSLEIGESLRGGVRVPVASVRVTQADGWDRVVPAAGLTACQTGEGF